MEKKPKITISSTDLAEIERQLEKRTLPAELVDALEDELARAKILPNREMPSNVVAIGSQVKFKVIETDMTFTKTLCLPEDISKYDDGISVFAPIGSAIIGLSTGQRINWQIQRSLQTVEIIEVIK